MNNLITLSALKDLWQTIFEKIARILGMNPQIAWEGGWSFALRATNTGLAFLSTVLLARLLGAESYGIYSYAYALVMLLTIPAQSGLPNLIVRETATGMALDQPNRVKGVWRWSGWLVGGLSLAIALVAGPLLYLWRAQEGDLQGFTLAWALALIPLIALGNLRGAALRGLHKIVAGQLPEFIIRPALFALFLVSIGLLSSYELSAPAAMAFQVLAALIAFIIGAWLLLRNTPSSISKSEPIYKGREWLISSMMFALIASFSVITKQVSTLILGLFESPDQVGIYRVAVQVATLAAFGLQAVGMVVGPTLRRSLCSRQNITPAKSGDNECAGHTAIQLVIDYILRSLR
jgi:O-antigen/teichoic acid export membrane protein